MAGELVKARLKEALDGIAKACAHIVRSVMDSDIGINDKTGTNTLTLSDAYKDVEAINVDNMGVINLLINEYAVLYIDAQGYPYARRPGLTKSDGRPSFPPVEVIRAWAAKNMLPTDNSTIYLISKSIWEKGIKARPFIEASFEEMDNWYGEWADQLFEALCAELDEFFNQ